MVEVGFMKKPITYGMIGSGRVARHLQHYFDLLHIPFVVWDRQTQTNVEPVMEHADVILVLIKDDAIESFLQNHPLLLQKPCIHFSGSLQIQNAQSFHPLCNFTDALYSDDFYPKIPFVVEKGRHTFSDIFPTLPNPHYEIAPEHQKLYHALCVIAGNFPTLLWQTCQNHFEKINLPKDIFYPYIENIAKQFIQNPENALTGPFARKDSKTIASNEASLEDSQLKEIYTVFKKSFL
ncbi:MAG: DUF2520 domain-containing protein [Bdellovibrionales bacterium]|nr:DUF2520 domain-containing protein [Bdellovibrionales bacterium]